MDNYHMAAWAYMQKGDKGMKKKAKGQRDSGVQTVDARAIYT